MFKTTANFKNDAAKAMYDYCKINNENLYFFFGKNSKWNETDVKTDLIPAKSNAASLYKDLILLYKFDRNALSLCYDRINWTKNTVMTQYNSDDISLKCYAMTKDFRIYKCISNGNGSHALYEPDHISFDIKSYADGYKWKYLYTLTTLERKAFLSESKIPITTYPSINSVQHLTEFYAEPGTIDSFDIIKSGSGYTNESPVTIIGDGTGATAKVFAQSGIIKQIVVTNPGKNYTWATATVGSPGILAEIKPNVSPFAGHGSNLFEELNVSSIMLNSKRLNTDANIDALPKTFDYRKVGLLSNINGNKNPLISMVHKVQVEDSTNFIANSKIKLNTNVTANVVSTEIVLGEHFIYFNETSRDLTNTDLLNATISLISDPTKNTIILKSLYLPSINKNFNILYLEHLDKSTVIDQELDILRIVIDF